MPDGTETILIVEDEHALRALITRVLTHRGYTVIAAASPQEAVGLILEDYTPIDLLLTDLVIPQMDGRELAQRITNQAPTMRVLFMSGYTDQSVTPAGSPGLSPFLEKPFSAGDLARKVREVLDTPADRLKAIAAASV